jgi:uncharacterized repeat protein (TIGR02543 family)
MATATINEGARIYIATEIVDGVEYKQKHYAVATRVVGFTTMEAAQAEAESIFSGTGIVATINRDAVFYALTYEADTTSAFFPNSQTVSFNASGGTTPSPESKVVVYGSRYGTLATTTKEGYTFSGWYTEADGAGDLITENSYAELTAAQTLYAYWV